MMNRNYVEKNNNIPIILLGTKLDECADKRMILYQEAKKFADSMNIYYFEISSKEEENIENIQQIFNIMYSEIEYKKREKELKKEEKKKKCTIL